MILLFNNLLSNYISCYLKHSKILWCHFVESLFRKWEIIQTEDIFLPRGVIKIVYSHPSPGIWQWLSTLVVFCFTFFPCNVVILLSTTSIAHLCWHYDLLNDKWIMVIIHSMYTLHGCEQNIFDLPVLPLFKNDDLLLITSLVPCLLVILFWLLFFKKIIIEC